MLTTAPMTSRTLSCLVVVCLFSACRSGPSPLSVPLRYTSMNPSYGPVDPCEAASVIEFKDTRGNPTVIGERFEEDYPARLSPVNGIGDTAEWYRSVFTSIARKTGLNMEQPGAPVLRIEIRELVAREAIAFNSVYNVRMVVAAQVIPAAGGTPCWGNSVEGEAKMYGRDASPENYLETLNHAAERSTAALLDHPQLRQALCACQAAKSGI